MELLQLRYFYDCARYGSIVKTAEKYSVPPSSVSASIRRLENELKNPLFERTSNRIALNEHGMRLKKSLDKVFSELDQTVADITCPVDDHKIRLLVRTMRERMTGHIIEYRKNHPNVCFEFVMSFDQLDYTDYDVIIDVASDKYGDYDCFELRNEQVHFCVTVDHPLAGKDLTMKQLKGQSFVTMGGNIHDYIEKACREAGFVPNIVAQVNDIVCYRKLMHSGNVIGYRRERADNANEGFCFLNVTDFKLVQKMCVYFKKGTSGPVENFVEFLRTKCV
jgi:DNA-binding transcriptional LysR family regulator